MKKRLRKIIIAAIIFLIAVLIDKINELFEFMENEIVEPGDGYFSNEFLYNGTLYTILNIEKISSDKKIIITDM